jgi:hypothetical protein
MWGLKMLNYRYLNEKKRRNELSIQLDAERFRVGLRLDECLHCFVAPVVRKFLESFYSRSDPNTTPPKKLKTYHNTIYYESH